MIISFEGMQGSGKTTLAVALAYKEHLRGARVISNSHLNFDHTKFDLEWFMENLMTTEIEDCILFLDEFYQIADSRSSQTKLNKLFTYFIVQTRKRGVDLYIATHHISNIDIRVQRAIDVRGACRHYKEKPCKKCVCGKCRGKGYVRDTICDECNGQGATGEIKGVICERCQGYGESGVTRGVFLDRRMRRRYHIDVESPKYWGLFATNERLPLQAKALQGIETLEVV